MNVLAFTSANALTALLTTESLLFAVFALTLGLGANPSARVSLLSSARLLGACAAALLTVLAMGAAVAWGDLFLTDWPDRFGRWFPVVVIGVGVLAQPVFAWLLVANLHRGPKRDVTDGF
jgi:hypothetical protein